MQVGKRQKIGVTTRAQKRATQAPEEKEDSAFLVNQPVEPRAARRRSATASSSSSSSPPPASSSSSSSSAIPSHALVETRSRPSRPRPPRISTAPRRMPVTRSRAGRPTRARTPSLVDASTDFTMAVLDALYNEEEDEDYDPNDLDDNPSFLDDDGDDIDDEEMLFNEVAELVDAKEDDDIPSSRSGQRRGRAEYEASHRTRRSRIAASSSSSSAHSSISSVSSNASASAPAAAASAIIDLTGDDDDDDVPPLDDDDDGPFAVRGLHRRGNASRARARDAQTTRRQHRRDIADAVHHLHSMMPMMPMMPIQVVFPGNQGRVEGNGMPYFYNLMMLLNRPSVPKGLTSREIDLFPVSLAPTALGECCICLDDMEIGTEIRRLPCMHPYHKQCIDTWLSDHRKCPLCRDVDVMQHIREL